VEESVVTALPTSNMRVDASHLFDCGCGKHGGSHMGIGIALMGSFEEPGNVPEQEQLDSLSWLINDLQNKIPTIVLIEEHHLSPVKIMDKPDW